MKKRTSLFIVLISLVCILVLTGLYGLLAFEDDTEYDFIIRGARVFDGSSLPAVRVDLAIKGDKIVKIDRPIRANANRIIDAAGFYISPGFIDLHTHADSGLYFPENRAAKNYLMQGVTSLVVGQCGTSAWPFFEKAEDQIERWSTEGIGPNATLLVGHGSVRQQVMGMEKRAPRPDELEEMKILVKEAMEQGAVGLSTGLVYRPGIYSLTEEVIELVKVIAPYGGIYHTHIRDEREKLLEAIQETIEIAEATGVPAHISHFKVMGTKNWGSVKEACALIEEARRRGLKITADQYPYQFANGYPYRSLVPSMNWTGEGKIERLSEEDISSIFQDLRDDHLLDLYKKVTPYMPLSDRHQEFLEALSRKELLDLVGSSLISSSEFSGLENPRDRMHFVKWMENPEMAEEIRRRIKTYIEDSLGGPENVVVGICVEKNLEGQTLENIAALKGQNFIDAAIGLEMMGAKCIPFQMCENDIEFIMNKDYVATGSDGTVPFYGVGLMHVRSYSTFFHKIKKYALERKSISVPQVIRSQTSLPAEIMNWKNRGWIKEGYMADIIVFDLKNIETPASISNPQQMCRGMKYMFINGQLVIDKGKLTGRLPGQIITLN